jgi:hypothetical protein
VIRIEKPSGITPLADPPAQENEVEGPKTHGAKTARQLPIEHGNNKKPNPFRLGIRILN